MHHYVPNIPHILVGTKVDLRDADPSDTKVERITAAQVDYLLGRLLLVQGKQMAQDIEAVTYMEVSSKTGKGVSEVFQEAVNLVLKDREGASTSEASGTHKSKKKKKNGNCILL